VSATVIAPTALEADALSTALTVLDAKEGIKLVDSLGDKYAAVVIFKNYQQIDFLESSNYGKYKRK